MESLQVLQASKGYEMIKKKAEDMYDMIKISILKGEELMNKIWSLLEVKEIKAIKALLPNVSEQEIINKIMDAIAHDETRSFDDHEKQQTILDMITYHSLQWKTFTMSSNQRTEYIQFKGLQMKTKILNQNSARTTRFQRGGFKTIKKIQKPVDMIHPDLPKPQLDPLPFNGYTDITNDSPFSDFDSESDYECSPLEQISFPLQNPQNSPVDSDDDKPYCPSSPQYQYTNGDDEYGFFPKYVCSVYGQKQDLHKIFRAAQFCLKQTHGEHYAYEIYPGFALGPSSVYKLFDLFSGKIPFDRFERFFSLTLSTRSVNHFEINLSQ